MSLYPVLMTRSLLCILALSFLAACNGSDDNDNLGVPGNSTQNVATPTVEGPIAGSATYAGTLFPLSSVGYREEEYFISGIASSFLPVNEFAPDGLWEVEIDQQADYRTRIVVIRPENPADFNGTVMVEWLNVSAGFDSAPDWGMTHTELIRSGYAWVGVSAQDEGIEALITGSADAILLTNSGDRYISLSHPGDDAFSYDIYSQVGQLLRSPTSPLGDLAVKRLMAAGESQSAGRLMTYLNALAPLHAMFDSYFVHSRTASSAPLQGELFGGASIGVSTVQVREDLGVPTLMLQTESDLFILGSYTSNQEDSENFRLWETAGTAHADLYTFLDARFDTGNNPSLAAVKEVLNPVPGFIECTIPVNAGPQRFVANAAVDALNRWMINGDLPAMADRLAVANGAFVVDALGNVEGGVRTPYVDVPIAVLSGEGQPQPGFDTENRDFCFLSGTTELFDVSTIASLYVDNDDYIAKVIASTDDTVAKGFLLEADADLIKSYVQGSDIFNP